MQPSAARAAPGSDDESAGDESASSGDEAERLETRRPEAELKQKADAKPSGRPRKAAERIGGMSMAEAEPLSSDGVTRQGPVRIVVAGTTGVAREGVTNTALRDVDGDGAGRGGKRRRGAGAVGKKNTRDDAPEEAEEDLMRPVTGAATERLICIPPYVSSLLCQ